MGRAGTPRRGKGAWGRSRCARAPGGRDGGELGRGEQSPAGADERGGPRPRNLPFTGLPTNPPASPFPLKPDAASTWEVFREPGLLSVTIVSLFLNEERQPVCFHLKFTPTFPGASTGTGPPSLPPGEGAARLRLGAPGTCGPPGSRSQSSGHLRQKVTSAPGGSGSCRDTGSSLGLRPPAPGQSGPEVPLSSLCAAGRDGLPVPTAIISSRSKNERIRCSCLRAGALRGALSASSPPHPGRGFKEPAETRIEQLSRKISLRESQPVGFLGAHMLEVARGPGGGAEL